MKIQRKFVIKIPENVSVIYSKKKKLITFVESDGQRRSLELNTQIFWVPHEKAIKISNLPFSKWEQIFKDPMTTAAAIDRLVHHSIILELNLPSYRLEKSKQKITGEENEC